MTAYDPGTERVRTFVVPDTLIDGGDSSLRYEIVGNEIFATITTID